MTRRSRNIVIAILSFLLPLCSIFAISLLEGTHPSITDALIGSSVCAAACLVAFQFDDRFAFLFFFGLGAPMATSHEFCKPVGLDQKLTGQLAMLAFQVLIFLLIKRLQDHCDRAQALKCAAKEDKVINPNLDAHP